MTLQKYINQFPRNQRHKIRIDMACKLGVSEVYIRSMCNGNKSIPGKYALAIEKITHGLVPKYKTCPLLYPPREFRHSLNDKK